MFGETRVSRALLDGEISGQQTTFFRAGHLRVPPTLPEALQRCGYQFDSSFTAPDVLTNFPYTLMANLGLEEETSVFEFPVTIEDEQSPALGRRVGSALDVIQANADNGAITVLLIHTNDTSKTEAEESLLQQLPRDVSALDMLTFARFWRARDRLQWSVQLTGDPREVILRARSDEPVSGLAFEFRRRVGGVEGGARLQAGGHQVILPDLQPGRTAQFRIRYLSSSSSVATVASRSRIK